MITKVDPTATMPISEVASRIDNTLAVVRKVGVVAASATTMTTNATEMVNSFSAWPTVASPRTPALLFSNPELIRVPQAA